MSINIGTAGVEAVQALRTQPDWTKLMDAMGVVVRDRLHAALESPPEFRVDATAYARGLSDLHTAFYAATKAINPRQVNKLSAQKAMADA